MKQLFLKSCFFLFFVLLFAISKCQINTDFPFLHTHLTIEERVNDLVSRLTLDEKISQMMDIAPAIPRLNITAYNWWNEGLHGVARAGIATVFPQAIALSATWDTSLIFTVSDAISTEFRAKYNEFVRNNSYGRYEGLTVWSPNINIFRDPRWGRGQETYGEDPYLTSRIAIAFIKGLQGNDSIYLKTIATPKHYIVHSGPEPSRHQFNAEISKRDFVETYSPAFEAVIKEGHAWSVMGAYNSILGVPACGNPFLLQHLLRKKWGFKGFVVSDCDAIEDIWKGHKYVQTAAEAAAISVKAGCDLNCGNCYTALKEAFEKGFINENEIDQSLKRLFEARFRLGMFDPAVKVSYSTIPYSSNDSKVHRKLALQAARESMVLLKNEKQLLPLDKRIMKIAVIGPNADNEDVIYGNYNGVSSKIVTPLEGIWNKVSSLSTVEYQKGCNLSDTLPELGIVTSKMISFQGESGLLGEYFDNIKFEGKPVLRRIDTLINFGWYYNAPSESLQKESYSVRWSGKLKVPKDGKYIFRLNSDERYKFYINNVVVSELENLKGYPGYFNIDLKANKSYEIKIEFIVNGGGASVKLEYANNDKSPIKDAVELAKKSDVIVFFGGLSPRLEGEEMKVEYAGFDGGDRTNIQLPTIQTKLLRLLKATGKPVVLVLMTGSSLAVNWAEQKIPSILLAWYPGEEGGNAIADVLFGDYNPAGRLNITWYKNENQLPAFDNYSMAGRTYKYLKEKPLYPFGYGISYTKFNYSNLNVAKNILTTDSLQVKVDVQNKGNIGGSEVAQIYIRNKTVAKGGPILSLAGFQRIYLAPGEKRTLFFTIIPKQFSTVDDEGNRIVMKGNFEISAGGGQPIHINNATSNYLTSNLQLNGTSIILETWE